MDTIITPKHHIFSTEEKTAHLTNPLFSNTDISFFAYSRYYPNNTLSILSTYADWTEAIFNQGKAISYESIFRLANQKININRINNSCYYFLRDDNKDGHALGKQYGIDSSLVIIDR